MGCTQPIVESRPAREFAYAAAALASEAVLLAQRLEPNQPPPEAASRALHHAGLATSELERIAREGGDLRSAYRVATWALEAASVALAEAKRLAEELPEPLPPVAPTPRAAAIGAAD